MTEKEKQAHFIKVQEKVLEHMVGDERSSADQFRFIVEHAPRFRYFSKHLPENLKKIWSRAASDTPEGEAARMEVERHYAPFAKEIFAFIDTLDPDARSAFTEAVEANDINKASTIMEAFLKLKNSTAE